MKNTDKNKRFKLWTNVKKSTIKAKAESNQILSALFSPEVKVCKIIYIHIIGYSSSKVFFPIM